MNIPAGYQLHISSWENDGNAHTTEILSGLSKEDVEFYLNLVGKFKSHNQEKGCYGNDDITSETLLHIIADTLSQHPNVSKEVKDNYTIDESDAEIAAEDAGDEAYELICNLLGRPVDEYYGNRFCRVFSDFQVFLYETPVKNVTTEFETTKKQKK